MKPSLTFWLVLVLIGLMGTKILLQRSEIAEVNEAAAKVAVSVANERTEAATKLAAAHALIRTKEQELRTEFNASEKMKYDQLQDANARASDLATRLRNSETKYTRLKRELSQASASTGITEAPTGSPEPELLGEFGEADVAEAKRAELIRSHLLGCYRAYDSLTQKLK